MTHASYAFQETNMRNLKKDSSSDNEVCDILLLLLLLFLHIYTSHFSVLNSNVDCVNEIIINNVIIIITINILFVCLLTSWH
jgi:hypothetical protein